MQIYPIKKILKIENEKEQKRISEEIQIFIKEVKLYIFLTQKH